MVHRVTEISTGRKFLAKFVNRQYRNALQYEMELWNKFWHPNLPYLYDAFDEGDICCLIYEK